MTDDTTPAEAIALSRIADIVPCTLDDAQRERLTDVVAQVAARAASAEQERCRRIIRGYAQEMFDNSGPVHFALLIAADLLAAQDTPPTTTEETR